MAYITYLDIETYLNISLKADGITLINTLCSTVEAYTNRYCNRNFASSSSQTEKFDGGVSVFLVKQPPISTITSVTVDGSALASTEYYNYTHYIKTLDLTNQGNQNVTIVYTTGATLPADVKHALVEWVSQMFKSSEDGGKVSQSVGIGSTNTSYLIRDGMPQFVKDVLDGYRLISGF